MNCAHHTDRPATVYCRTCGKGLCDDCKRDVLGVMYCEPCIAARMQQTLPHSDATTPIPVAVAPVVDDAPSPALAAILAVVPGLGAIYNSQYMKGLVHVLIFATLIWGANNVEEVFGILIPFFLFYMIFDAYRTAKARRYGMPLPEDFFGLNSITGTAVAPAPSRGGDPKPPTGAYVLIGLGAVMLLGNFGIFRWDWMDRLWPLALIALGVWLFMKRQQEVVSE